MISVTSAFSSNGSSGPRPATSSHISRLRRSLSARGMFAPSRSTIASMTVSSSSLSSWSLHAVQRGLALVHRFDDFVVHLGPEVGDNPPAAAPGRARAPAPLPCAARSASGVPGVPSSPLNLLSAGAFPRRGHPPCVSCPHFMALRRVNRHRASGRCLPIQISWSLRAKPSFLKFTPPRPILWERGPGGEGCGDAPSGPGGPSPS